MGYNFDSVGHLKRPVNISSRFDGCLGEGSGHSFVGGLRKEIANAVIRFRNSLNPSARPVSRPGAINPRAVSAGAAIVWVRSAGGSSHPRRHCDAACDAAGGVVCWPGLLRGVGYRFLPVSFLCFIAKSNTVVI